MQDLHTGKATFSALSTIWKHWPSMPFRYALTMVPLIWVGSLCWVPQAFPETSPESEIETLDVIEITGTIVEQTPRELNFPSPEIPQLLHPDETEHRSLPKPKLVRQIPATSKILLDQTAKTRNIHTRVKPLKTERPPYPRRAREQGWHGRIILRLKISPNGTVESSIIHQSSGHQLLDDSAVNAAAQWTFDPAKNGGFPVASIVNIPIQFDLLQ